MDLLDIIGGFINHSKGQGLPSKVQALTTDGKNEDVQLHRPLNLQTYTMLFNPIPFVNKNKHI